MANDVYQVGLNLKILMGKTSAHSVVGEPGLITISVSCPVNGLENFDTHEDLITKSGDFLFFKTGNGGVIGVRWDTVLAISARRGAFDVR